MKIITLKKVITLSILLSLLLILVILVSITMGSVKVPPLRSIRILVPVHSGSEGSRERDGTDDHSLPQTSPGHFGRFRGSRPFCFRS